MDSAKLSLFSKLDTPVPNQSHGMKQFLYGLTDADLQQRRARLLAVGKQDLVDAVQKYVLEPAKKEKSSKVVFGTATTDFEALASSGWKIEKFSDGLNLRQRLYEGEGDEEEDKIYETL